LTVEILQVFSKIMAKKGSVLICDDEEIMRDVLETILSSAGYRVDLAKTGEEAIELYAQKSYDVVLMDVSMPGMGGLTALEEIIKMDAEAVVLMITAYATFDTAISAWEKGATGIHSQTVSKRANRRARRARREKSAQRRRTSNAAASDDALGQARRDYRALR
jgi:DNA-binding NtrC family response regulator